jgi:hypothetical protein
MFASAFRPSAIAAISLLMVASCLAAEGNAGTFNISDDASFAGYRAPLIEYLRSRHRATGTQVCVLGEYGDDGSRWAWVIWPQGNTMLLWAGGTSSMVGSRRILDLRKDVVKSEDELRGSNYLVTRGWVKSQETRCKTQGTVARVLSGELQGDVSRHP